MGSNSEGVLGSMHDPSVAEDAFLHFILLLREALLPLGLGGGELFVPRKRATEFLVTEKSKFRRDNVAWTATLERSLDN